MHTEPINVSDQAFQRTVLESELPVIVDFWAPWCGPCLMVGPILERIASDYSGRIVVAKVNTDEHSQWAMKYGVQGIPTMLFVVDGRIVHRQTGAVPEPYLKDMVEEMLSVAEERAEAAAD